MNRCPRWMLTAVMGLSVFVLGGCKFMSLGEYRELAAHKTLTKSQKVKLVSLVKDKDKLTTELTEVRARLKELQKSADISGLTAREVLSSMKMMGEVMKKLRNDNADLADKLGQSGGPLADLGPDVVVGSGVDGIFVRMSSDLTFASGRHALKESAKKVLAKVASALKDRPGKIRISGYTDSVPLKSSKVRYESNLELSAKRALSVLYYLAKAGIPAGRMHVAGFGEHALIMENGKENKAKSRRAEIWLLTPRKVAE